MNPDFWHDRWREGQIGFHQPDYHPALLRHWPRLGVPPHGRVFVPLCGRSLDMIWLARQGHGVVGVELSPIAIDGFFHHEGLTPSVTEIGRLRRHAAGHYELLEGDFFETSPAMLGHIEGWYDRAALVALPRAMRRDYVRRLDLLVPGDVPGLLITLDYPQQQMDGPPFSVTGEEVLALLDEAFEVTELESRDVLGENPRFAERGLDRLTETVFRLVRR
ncbi:MAG: hypothetical protein AMJ58_04335 [Gammaproteobacteria bacterium SG8_30]|nr:MAG: hypothetical protein AMJ58_04335 [Gammaproteobacteria bacterium SG8_30]